MDDTGTLFDEAGLVRPNEVYLSGGWTWDTVVEMGKKITRDTNGDGVKDIWMLESPSTWVPDWVAKVHQFGGRSSTSTAPGHDRPAGSGSGPHLLD